MWPINFSSISLNSSSTYTKAFEGSSNAIIDLYLVITRS